MKAVIMAGGEGTRLRPLTSNCPKPMLPLANRPMMEHIVELLRRHGIEEVVVTVAFMANAIRTYFGDGSEFGVELTYVDEPAPLGTAGSVRNAADLLTERFIAEVELQCAGFDLTLATPRNADIRGSQVSFRHVEGYAIMQVLIARGVIGDFRAPEFLPG